jgi:hypothetical protein
MLLGLDFMTLDQISNMSLNDLRIQVGNRDKTKIGTWMDASMVALDMRHYVSVSGAPLPSFNFPEKHLLEDLRH